MKHIAKGNQEIIKLWLLTIVWIIGTVCSPLTVSHASIDGAIVLDIQGGKAFYGAGDRKGSLVQILDFLSPGDRLNLNENVRLVLNFFDSGIKEIVEGSGVLEIGTGQSLPKGMLTVHQEKAFDIPGKALMDIRNLQHVGATVLRSTGKNEYRRNQLTEIKPLTLTDTNVKNRQPLFAWNAVQGADRYRIRVTDTSDNLKWEIDTTDTSKQFDNGKLNNGELYLWSILAFSNNQITAKGEGQFSLVSQKEIKQIEAAEEKIVSNDSYSEMERLFYLAMLYHQYELFDDLTQIVQSIHKKQPENPTIHHWLKSLKYDCKMGEKIY